VTRGDLTGAQWAVLEPLLQVGIKPGRPPVHSKRQLIDGIRFRTRTGVPWQTCPRATARETVYGLFRRWQRDATWHRIFEQLQARADAKGLITWDISIDSTIARAHQHIAGTCKKGICRSNRPAVSSPSRTTTGSDAHAAD
jgi:transposase